MGFDLHLDLPSDSPEAEMLREIVRRDHVSPEEAVRIALRQAAFSQEKAGAQSANRGPNLKVAEEKPIFGLFAGNREFGEAIDEVIGTRSDRYGDHS